LKGDIIVSTIGGVGKMEGVVRQKMPTKFLEKEETLPANTLRNISQKALMEMVSNYDKLGLIVNNNLSIAMLSWENYEGLVDLIEEQNEKISEFESLIEDLQLASQYGADVLRVEKGQSTSYEIDTTEDLFKMLDDK
jgi:hypothetical protein